MHVVAYFNAFDNTLEQFIVHGATTWKEALKDAYIQMLRNKNRDTDIEQVAQESIDSLPDDYEEACTEAFDGPRSGQRFNPLRRHLRQNGIPVKMALLLNRPWLRVNPVC